jgi:hypothetical protein
MCDKACGWWGGNCVWLVIILVIIFCFGGFGLGNNCC